MVFLIRTLLLAVIGTAIAFSRAAQADAPVPVIIDTDICTDCDDAGAVALLNKFMNEGSANLIGCVVDARDADLSSGAAIQAINAYYGHPSILIGAYHGPLVQPSGSHYTKAVHAKFDPTFPADDKLPAGVDVYRKALAAADDGSVVIVSVGFLPNLQDLLDSKPDAISPLAGPALVKQKVKQLVLMGGSFPHSNGDFNFGSFNLGALSTNVLANWPTPLIYSGGEIGNGLSLGQGLQATPDDNPVKMIYSLFGDSVHNALKDGRQGWDPSAAWLAVCGPGNFWNVVSGGTYKMDPATGGGTWTPDPAGTQSYITVKRDPKLVAQEMDKKLAEPPQ
jgi:hypothetical protein